MRTLRIIQSRRAAGLFRICMGMIVLLSLVTSGMLLNIAPVQALDLVPVIVPPTFNAQECQSQTITFVHDGNYILGLTPPHNTFFWLWGALPPGSNWNMTTGVLTLCPPLGSSAGGTPAGSGIYPFWICVISMDNMGIWDIGPWHATSITVTPIIPPLPLVITPIVYQVAWENMPFNMTLAATGCSGVPANYNWACTGLPVGLTLDPLTGIINGNPAPGTCGTYTVTVTCNDTSMCPTAGCCPAVTTTFTLLVDCWANYIVLIPAISSCNFDVAIGTGLSSGQTPVLVDGVQEATLAGGGSETFTSYPCESHLVMVNQTVEGFDPNTRFEVIGSNTKLVNDVDNYAFFDYAKAVLIETGSNPDGITQLPGRGYYALGSSFSSSAPSPIDATSQQGTKYVFKDWQLPNSGTNPNRDLLFTVSTGGKVIAEYNTYYLLNIVSDYPSLSESSWELKDGTASYNVALQQVPIPNFWGVIGGVMRPMNASGTHVMTGPATVKIEWMYDYTIPVIVIVVTLLIIAGIIFLVLRRKGTTVPAAATATSPSVATETKTTPVAPAAVEKKSITEGTSDERPNFCPKCGAPVDKDAEFCKKCGNKLVK